MKRTGWIPIARYITDQYRAVILIRLVGHNIRIEATCRQKLPPAGYSRIRNRGDKLRDISRIERTNRAVSTRVSRYLLIGIQDGQADNMLGNTRSIEIRNAVDLISFGRRNGISPRTETA